MTPLNPISKIRWAQIRLFAMDVDGILTDGRVFVGSDNAESKAFSVLDGFGLAGIREAGIEVAWISGRASGATSARAAELKIAHLIQGRNDKEAGLREVLRQTGIPLEAACYMGDDVIDVPAMQLAGIGISVPEAAEAVRQYADWITVRAGGFGAVREICDLLLESRKS